MEAPSSDKLAKFYAFFEMHNRERLDGLDASYFPGMNQREKDAAWSSLTSGWLSAECIIGLHLLDEARAVALFKTELKNSTRSSPYADARREIEGSRLLMLSMVDDAEPAAANATAMLEFSFSESETIRAQFARVVPSERATPQVIDALVRMVLTESATQPLICAIDKLMVVFGRSYFYENDEPADREIDLALRSKDHRRKIAGLRRLGVSNLPSDPQAWLAEDGSAPALARRLIAAPAPPPPPTPQTPPPADFHPRPAAPASSWSWPPGPPKAGRRRPPS